MIKQRSECRLKNNIKINVKQGGNEDVTQLLASRNMLLDLRDP